MTHRTFTPSAILLPKEITQLADTRWCYVAGENHHGFCCSVNVVFDCSLKGRFIENAERLGNLFKRHLADKALQVMTDGPQLQDIFSTNHGAVFLHLEQDGPQEGTGRPVCHQDT